MTEPLSHRRHPVDMVTAHVKADALNSVHSAVHSSSSPQSLGLFSIAAVLSLIMWYIFSFLTLFMNKYTLDALEAEPFLFCEYFYLLVARQIV